MEDKQSAGYHETAPGDRHPCVICRHFEPITKRCDLVAGRIDAWGTCDRWEGVLRAA